MTFAVSLAEWCAALRHEDVPEDVRLQARRAILDVSGVMAAGSVHPAVAALRRSFEAERGPCTVAGGGSAFAATAALINGAAAHAWDFDDTSYTGIMHGSAVIFPAILAIAERDR